MNRHIFLFALSVVALASADIDYNLLLRSENAIYTNKAEFQKAEAYGKLQLDVDFDDDRGKLRMVGAMKGDIKNNIYPDKYTTNTYDNLSKPLALGNSGVAQLREFYYENSIGDTSYKIGKMQSVWGKADGIKLLDVLNPQDFSEFILAPFDESRIPLWTLSLTHQFQESELELLYIPDTTRHKLAQDGADYAVTTSRIVPQAVPGLSVTRADIITPDNPIKDATVALRYSTNIKEFEVSLYALDGYNNLPTFYQNLDLSAKSITVSPKYERYRLYGMSMDYSAGEFVYRFESAYMQDKYFLNKKAPQGVQKEDEFSYVFGVDWYGLDETVLSAQLFQSYLLTSADGFSRPKTDTTLTFLYKEDFLNNTLHAEVLFIHNINDADGLIRPKIKYELDEETLLYSGIDHFYGSKDGLYGEFRDKSRVIFGIERTF